MEIMRENSVLQGIQTKPTYPFYEKITRYFNRVNLRYKYYEMKNAVADLEINLPPKLRGIRNSLGWIAKSVDTLADRLVPVKFDNDVLNFNEIFDNNNSDILYRSAILEALIGSCSFISISPNGDDLPLLQVFDGRMATGEIDEQTGFLEWGVSILDTDASGFPTSYAVYLKDRTDYFDEKGEIFRSIKHSANRPLLVPIIYRPSASRPFGHSRISRSAMNLVSDALRTLKASEISQMFYSFPQRYVIGLSQGVEKDNKWEMALSSFMAFYKDEDNQSPTVGEFNTPSFAPFNERLKSLACLFSGETGLSLQELGFNDGNPASADAITNSREPLLLNARAAQRSFGIGFKNVGMLASMIRDKQEYKRSGMLNSNLEWLPPFEHSINSLADGLIKLNQISQGFITPQIITNLTGIQSPNSAPNTTNENTNIDEILNINDDNDAKDTKPGE
jgi:hypothetical protein